MKRAHQFMAFAIIFLACLGGMLQASLWFVCACACVLALLSLLGLTRSGAQQRAVMGSISPPVLFASAAINATAASAAAFVLGIAIGQVFGVADILSL